MLRPNSWIIGLLTVVLTAGVSVRPGAGTLPVSEERPLRFSPNTPLLLEGCPSVEEREAFEGSDCLQVIRYALLEGRIDLDEAVARLESCAGGRGDLTALVERTAADRAAEFSAFLAFGIPTDSLHLRARADADEALRTRLANAATEIPRGAVATLRSAGIGPDGLARGREEIALARLRSDDRALRAVAPVLGEPVAADLSAILGRDADARPPAVVIGRTVVAPNFSDTQETQPIVVGAETYTLWLAAELRGLEAARLRYLSSAARANQETGSVRSFLASVRRRGKPDPAKELAERQVEVDRATMLARLDRLESRLGAHPLLLRSAAESIGLASGISERCQASASRRGGLIRTGAGVVAGLVFAAGAVVVTGATGTLIGGITIAAALEATVGAYLVARSERFGDPIVTTGRLSSVLPAEAEELPFRRPEAELAAQSGEDGGGGGEIEQWFDDEGVREELLGLAGEGIEDEESEGDTASGPKENTIPPVLPVEEPEELRELPPLLDGSDAPQLASLSLPEIQERLDDFLSLRDPAMWAMSAETDEPIPPVSIEEMIAEARVALGLWQRERRLHEGFGPFFVNAELERVPVARRGDVLPRAFGRYMHDRDLFHDAHTVHELRDRLAERLVTHCRAGDGAGDLVLSACSNETALSILLVAALRDAGIRAPAGYTLGVQAFGARFEAVLHSRDRNEVYSLTKGTRTEGVVAPIFYPATFYYAYLVSHNVVPEIDFDRHLVVALPNRAMPEALQAEACEAADGGSVVGRAVGWLGSLVGVRRIADDPCGDDRSRSQGANRGGGGASIDITMPT
ncbi:MAG TPA: hypothetical protein VMN39_05605, partial [Longimicrobiaceae bacterium]|nr:hypothetical protein [Longimicrobiaceae bacterium]